MTIYNNIQDTKGVMGFSLDYILDLIQDGSFSLKNTVEKCREYISQGNIDEYKSLKMTLPLFAGGGDFTYRNSNPQNLKSYSNILILDFDFDDQAKIPSFKENLIRNATPLHLYAIWLSPGKGVKAAIIHDNQDPLLHHQLFTTLKNTLFPEADPNCSDICRTTFLSYDPDLFINHDPDLVPYHFVPLPGVPSKQSAATKKTYGKFTHTPEEIAMNEEFQKTTSDKTVQNKLHKVFNIKNPDYFKDGNRHSEVKRRAVLMCKDGVLIENAIASLVGQFGENSRASLNNKDIESMVNSCYNNARHEFGKDRNKFINK